MFSSSLGDASQMHQETKQQKGQAQETTQASAVLHSLVKDSETAIQQRITRT